jgi:hypothetical protein
MRMMKRKRRCRAHDDETGTNDGEVLDALSQQGRRRGWGAAGCRDEFATRMNDNDTSYVSCVAMHGHSY